MTPSEAQAIIQRCTRDGRTLWAHVAAQLGVSVDTARARYDMTYARAHIWAPSREADPEMEPPVEAMPDAEAYKSPKAKCAGLKAEILLQLAKHSMSVEALSATLNSPRSSIRKRLDTLHDAGKVDHDGRYPRTWWLKTDDEIGAGALSGAGVAA